MILRCAPRKCSITQRLYYRVIVIIGGTRVLDQGSDLFDAIPELGMGYHFGVVEGPNAEGGDEGVIVLNAQYAVTPKDVVNRESFERLLLLVGREVGPDIEVTIVSAPSVVPRRSIVPSEDIVIFARSFGGLISNLNYYKTLSKLHASPPFPLLTKSREDFVRFSAFRNDRRVQPDGSLLPGTYVTSKRDAAFAPSGFAVVGRYALPNMLPAIYRFDVSVPTRTPGLVGTVAPAFGQAGGGAEIEFTNGTPTGSVTGPTTIPEY